LPAHVDVRGEGGYTIMPPGALADDAPKSPGGRYRWRFSPETTEVAAMPAGLEAVLRAPGSGKAAPAVPEADDEEKEEPTPDPSRSGRGEGQGGARSIDAGDEAVRKYALAAADAEIRTLAATGDGGRNNALNAAAFNLGTLVAAGGLSEGLARGMLIEVARQWPDLPKSEGTIDSGLGAGMASPRDLGEVRAKAEDRARFTAGKPRGRVSAANTAAAPAAATAEAGQAKSKVCWKI
jgi:putative DNA primase/helicase